MQMLKRTLITATGALVAALAFVAPAQAGMYHVYSCTTPAGEAAPADGWSGTVAPGGAFDDYALDTCREGGALIAALGDETTHASNIDQVSWSLEVPAFDQVVAEKLVRAAYLHGRNGDEATYQYWLAAPIAKKVFEECVYSLGCETRGEVVDSMSIANQLAVPAANLGAHLTMNVSCGGLDGAMCSDGFGDSNGYAAAVYLFAADILLEQAAGPSVSGVSGDLADASSVSGTSAVLFTASDPGAGVYEAVISIDGSVVQQTVLDENGGRCSDVGETGDGLAAFLYLQPCKSSVAADVGLDTTVLSDGAHHLLVSVLDAAGNSAPVLDRMINVANPTQPGPSAGGASGEGAVGGEASGAGASSGGAPASAAGASAAGAPLLGSPNGVNASTHAKLTLAWKGVKGTRMTKGYGRASVVQGRLTDESGTPISGALIELAAVPNYTGAAAVAMPPVRTGADGRFIVRLPRGTSSRTLRFSYQAHIGDAAPVATATLALIVRARVSLSISPRTASVGRTIHFRGRLLGTPIPRGGKQLVLEARSPGGRWIEFKVIRSGAHGRFRAGYRFKFPGPATYQFRVHSEAEADFPYAAGNSNTVIVRER